jgi:ABC-type proline/glycine betaine transport system substrate-binding protein
MKSIVAFVALALMSVSASAVTLDDIAKQAATVKQEQAKLDSLQSLYRAETISAKGLAAGVKVMKATVNSQTGLTDPEFVDVDIPYSTWTPLQQAQWRAELAEARLKATYVSIGRYRVHNAQVQKFLALVATVTGGE